MPKKKIFNLSNEIGHAIYLVMLRRSVNGKMKWGTTKAVASEFSVSMCIVQRFWKRAKHVSNNEAVDVSSLRSKNCGRKRVQFNLEQLKKCSSISTHYTSKYNSCYKGSNNNFIQTLQM